MTDTNDALRAEFDILAARAGIEIQPERREPLFNDYLELKRLAGLLRQPRKTSAEPSNVFDVSTILRAG